jgi:hypothetical protein
VLVIAEASALEPAFELFAGAAGKGFAWAQLHDPRGLTNQH